MNTLPISVTDEAIDAEAALRAEQHKAFLERFPIAPPGCPDRAVLFAQVNEREKVKAEMLATLVYARDTAPKIAADLERLRAQEAEWDAERRRKTEHMNERDQNVEPRWTDNVVPIDARQQRAKPKKIGKSELVIEQTRPALFVQGLADLVEVDAPFTIVGDRDSGKSTIAETYLAPLILADRERRDNRLRDVVRISTDYPPNTINPAPARMAAAGVPTYKNRLLESTGTWDADMDALRAARGIMGCLLIDNIQQFLRVDSNSDFEVSARLEELIALDITQIWISHRPRNTSTHNQPRDPMGSIRFGAMTRRMAWAEKGSLTLSKPMLSPSPSIRFALNESGVAVPIDDSDTALSSDQRSRMDDAGERWHALHDATIRLMGDPPHAVTRKDVLDAAATASRFGRKDLAQAWGAFKANLPAWLALHKGAHRTDWIGPTQGVSA